MLRLFTAICVAGLLSACVGSDTALLPEAQGISNAALAGNWSYPDGDKIVRLNVTRQGSGYLIKTPSEPDKKPVIASLHSLNASWLVIQMRGSGGGPVQYVLATKDDSRPGRTWRLRPDVCDRTIADAAGLKTIKADRFTCTVTTRAQLETLLHRAAGAPASDGAKPIYLTQDSQR